MIAKETYETLRQVAVSGPREQQLEPMAGTLREVTGLKTETRFGAHAVVIDEPVGFGGAGTAANPAEVLLAALGASLQVTLRVYAALMEIPIERIALDLSGTLDTRGFFDADPKVRAGFDAVTVKVAIASSAGPDRIRELLRRAERACPVLDMVRAPTPVTLQLEMPSA